VTGDALKPWADEARDWLFDAVFPLWSRAGFDDASGQFVEALDLAGLPQRQTPRRTLVQARQLYVFSIAARLGWTGPWRAVMTAAADTLLARGRTPDGDWIYSFDAAGQPLDGRTDLYTQAFAIFGLVHAAEALGRPDLLAAARQTRARLDGAWRARAGGFVEGEVITDRRRQNPHMHLFEASLALCEAGDGEPEDAALAAELWDLFKARFYSPAGVVEFFDDALSSLPGERGASLEPGHAFEWSWLAAQWSAIGGADTTAEAAQLYGAGLRGVGPLGAACDEAKPDSTVKIATARCWPQTEWLKAALARLGRTGDTAGEVADVGRARTALLAYREGVVAGAWRDRRLADGGWAEGPAPASSGYHIVCALNALIEAAKA
jgi:mannose/cellobiose epimerase-like protein (N-acyl-D-glucosamine 2-epimerase family)